VPVSGLPLPQKLPNPNQENYSKTSAAAGETLPNQENYSKTSAVAGKRYHSQPLPQEIAYVLLLLFEIR